MRTNRCPPAPKQLDGPARAKWAEVMPVLQGRGAVDQGTADALTAYCLAWARYAAAETALREHGPIVKSPSGYPIQNPWLAVANKAEEQLRKWAGELGLTPASKSRLRGRTGGVEAEPPAPPLVGLRLLKAAR